MEFLFLFSLPSTWTQFLGTLVLFLCLRSLVVFSVPVDGNYTVCSIRSFMIFAYIPHTSLALSPLCSRIFAVLSYCPFCLLLKTTAFSLCFTPNISFAKTSINLFFHFHLPKIVSKYLTYYNCLSLSFVKLWCL